MKTMTHAIIGTAVLSGAGMLTSASEAGTGATTIGAKVTAVQVMEPRNHPLTGGKYVQVWVKFDRNVGSGCSINNAASVLLVENSNSAIFAVYQEHLNSVRQMAMSALLSGKLVDVLTMTGPASCTFFDGSHTLERLVVK
jgi:hypothetical protein